MALENVYVAVKITWYCVLVSWFVVYISVQVQRITYYGSKWNIFQETKEFVEKKEKEDCGILLYFGIVWEGAPYLYPVRSLAVWIILVVVTFIA
ncbi:MAG: hypothetical protein LBI68_00765 [Azoarcus sp.]|nr:hypothetical protein [Azoarcus sp.]